jgi:hypothetical protein
MIYGVLSIVSGELQKFPKEIEPDYSKPFPDVCRSYAKFIAEHTGDLSFLWRFWNGNKWSQCDRTQGEIPSWVPSFCSRAPLAGFKTLGIRRPSFSTDGSIMFVEGMQVDKVYSSVNPEPRATGQVDATDVLPNQARRVYKLLEVAATMQSVPVNVLLEDWLKSFEGMVDRVYDPSESEVVAVSSIFMSWIQSNVGQVRDTNLVKKDSHHQSARVKHIIDAIERQLVHSSVFLTRSGSIWASGHGNEAVQASDILCILRGAPAPTILRPTRALFAFLNIPKLFVGPGVKNIEDDSSVWDGSVVFALI